MPGYLQGGELVVQLPVDVVQFGKQVDNCIGVRNGSAVAFQHLAQGLAQAIVDLGCLAGELFRAVVQLSCPVRQIQLHYALGCFQQRDPFGKAHRVIRFLILLHLLQAQCEKIYKYIRMSEISSFAQML